MPKCNYDAEHDLQTRLAVDAFTRNYDLYPWEEEDLATVAVNLPTFGLSTFSGGVKMTAEQMERINSMSQYQLCAMWRFARPGEPLLQGDTGRYFQEKLKENGGFTPEISKSLGWGNQ